MEFKLKYEGPWTDTETVIVFPVGTWRFQRPVTKVEKCCQCGWCYIFCPNGAVVDKGTHFAANLDCCKGCGVCTTVCPVNAIVMIREGG